MENSEYSYGKLLAYYPEGVYSRWGLVPHRIPGGIAWSALHQQMHVQNSSDHEECWMKVAAELDERFKGKEDAVISGIHFKHRGIQQNSLILISCKQRNIEKALTKKLTELIDQKVQELERQICQKVEEKLRAMEERINTAESKILRARRNVGISGVGSIAREASEENTETHFCSEVMKKMGEMDARLAVLEAVTQKSVIYFFPKVEVMLKHINLSS